tara:strand:+ start:3702 stop:5012 length:1311 start_codon:yes stop_codon:yes gene_type:complete
MMSLRIFKISTWLPVVIVIFGLFLGHQIVKSSDLKPTKTIKKQQKRARIVQASSLEKGSVEPVWLASGRVIPSETIKIHGKVSGDVTKINSMAQPGQTIKSGEWLVKLDPIDFELAVKSQQAYLAQANATLALEQADQVLAKEELTLLNQSSEFLIDQDLVLRKPQLAVAQSKVDVATTNLDKAKLNLSRTLVVMPFDGKITDKYIGRGSKVSANTALFSVTNTKKYWLEVKIPHSFLSLLNQEEAYKVTQDRVWGKEKYREAHFISILAELDSKDRQVKVLLAIDNPLVQQNSHQPQVFINDFVNVELKGKTISDAWTIKYHWLQSDNTIWVVDNKKTLQKRSVKVLFKGRDLIYVSGMFEQGDLALSEKPGIASIGLPVKVKRIDVLKPKYKPKHNALSRSVELEQKKKLRKLQQDKKSNTIKFQEKQGINNDV